MAQDYHANVRIPARVYDVEGGAIFAKNSTFVFFDGFAWSPRLRSPSAIMAPAPDAIQTFNSSIQTFNSSMKTFNSSLHTFNSSI